MKPEPHPLASEWSTEPEELTAQNDPSKPPTADRSWSPPPLRKVKTFHEPSQQRHNQRPHFYSRALGQWQSLQSNDDEEVSSTPGLSYGTSSQSAFSIPSRRSTGISCTSPSLDISAQIEPRQLDDEEQEDDPDAHGSGYSVRIQLSKSKDESFFGHVGLGCPEDITPHHREQDVLNVSTKIRTGEMLEEPKPFTSSQTKPRDATAGSIFDRNQDRVNKRTHAHVVEPHTLSCPLIRFGCQETFSSSYGLKRHVAIVHTHQGYWQCDLCSPEVGDLAIFDRRDLFEQHVQNIHPDALQCLFKLGHMRAVPQSPEVEEQHSKILDAICNRCRLSRIGLWNLSFSHNSAEDKFGEGTNAEYSPGSDCPFVCISESQSIEESPSVPEFKSFGKQHLAPPTASQCHAADDSQRAGSSEDDNNDSTNSDTESCYSDTTVDSYFDSSQESSTEERAFLTASQKQSLIESGLDVLSRVLRANIMDQFQRLSEQGECPGIHSAPRGEGNGQSQRSNYSGSSSSKTASRRGYGQYAPNRGSRGADDQEGSKRRENRGGGNPTKEASEKGLPVRLACPFWVHDPETYCEAHSDDHHERLMFRLCATSTFSRFRDIRFHLKRKHMRPLQCERCCLICHTPEELTRHLRQDGCDVLDPPEYADGITERQFAEITRLTSKRDMTTYDKWGKTYKFLFPNDPLAPAAPPAAALPDSSHTGGFSEFVMERLPLIIMEVIDPVLKTQIQQLLRLCEPILPTCLERIHREWLERQNGTASEATGIGLQAQPNPIQPYLPETQYGSGNVPYPGTEDIVDGTQLNQPGMYHQTPTFQDGTYGMQHDQGVPKGDNFNHAYHMGPYTLPRSSTFPMPTHSMSFDQQPTFTGVEYGQQAAALHAGTSFGYNNLGNLYSNMSMDSQNNPDGDTSEDDEEL